MTPKEIDESLLGFEQEVEPTLPSKLKKHLKVSVHPVTGEAMIERERKSKRDQKVKVKGESKQQRQQAR